MYTNPRNVFIGMAPSVFEARLRERGINPRDFQNAMLDDNTDFTAVAREIVRMFQEVRGQPRGRNTGPARNK